MKYSTVIKKHKEIMKSAYEGDSEMYNDLMSAIDLVGSDEENNNCIKNK